MAKFETAYKITMNHEGGYANNPKDIGGETYKGISRKFHPRWEGWKIIDQAKKTGRSFPDVLFHKDYDELNKIVPEFYKERYWDVFVGDDMQYQIIANELFDTGINMGTQRAIIFLQKSINLLKQVRGIVTTDELIVDGIFGQKTFTALNTIKPEYVKHLYNLLNLMQGNHYLDYISKDFRQAEFLVGWLNRLEIKRS